MGDAILEYVEAKYGSGGPDADRFGDDPDDVVHTSQVAACQRKHYWNRRRGKPHETSVYFELGRVFEMMYGAALAWERGDLSRAQLAELKPWELADRVDAIEQDVNIGVDFGPARITGEADWAVYKDSALTMVSEHGGVDEVEVNEDGERAVRWHDGEVTRLDSADVSSPFELVIETKTKKDLDMLDGEPQEKHFWQTYGYMYGMGAPGKVTYMQRNDWESADFHLERSDAMDMDLEARVRRKAKNLEQDEVPVADPPSKWSCYYCPHRSSCGASLW